MTRECNDNAFAEAICALCGEKTRLFPVEGLEICQICWAFVAPNI